MQRSTSLRASEDESPIVVVGAGLSGSALAVGLAQKGYPVVLMSKHAAGSRSQQIKLDKKSIKFLKRFFDSSDPRDRKIIENLERNSTETIGGIEKFLHRKVKSETNVRLITEDEEELVGVDMQLGKITVEGKDKKKREIPFRHIIDSSGNARVAYMLANGVDPKDRGDPERKKWESAIGYQPKHAAQGTASLHLAKGNYKPGFLRKMLFKTIHKVRVSKKDVAFLQKRFGWEQTSPPQVYVISNNERTKFYVGGDVPERFLHLDEKRKKEEVEAWTKCLLSISTGLKEEDLYVKEKSNAKEEKQGLEKEEQESESKAKAQLEKLNLKRTVFHLKLMRATRMVLSNPEENKHLFLIGDAIQSAYFHEVHGSNDALAAVEKFLECLPDKNSNKEFDMPKWIEFVNSLVEQHDKRMRKVGSHRLNERNRVGFFSSENSIWVKSSPPSQRRSAPLLIQKSPSLNDLKITSQVDDDGIKKPSVSGESPADSVATWQPGKKK